MKDLTQRLVPMVLAMVLSLGLVACGSQPPAEGEREGEAGRAEEAGEHAAAESPAVEGGGEHARAEEGGEHSEGGEGGEHAQAESGEHSEGGEHGEGEGGHDEEGEESGVYIGAAETWDVVRRGARLVLSFDSGANAFVGTVENTTEQTLCAVRVEVHLSTGTELGPTARTDVPAGESTSVRLPTGGESFETWTAHPETLPCGE